MGQCKYRESNIFCSFVVVSVKESRIKEWETKVNIKEFPHITHLEHFCCARETLAKIEISIWTPLHETENVVKFPITSSPS